MVLTYEDIDALRLKAFRTNGDADRKAYFEAASKWFQDEIYRRMERERTKINLYDTLTFILTCDQDQLMGEGMDRVRAVLKLADGE